MHICLCRNFNTAKVTEVIKAHPEAERAKDVYLLCADAQKPQCGKCLPDIQKIQKSCRRQSLS